VTGGANFVPMDRSNLRGRLHREQFATFYGNEALDYPEHASETNQELRNGRASCSFLRRGNQEKMTCQWEERMAKRMWEDAWTVSDATEE